MFNSIVIWCAAARSRAQARKDVMETIPWSLKQQTFFFFLNQNSTTITSFTRVSIYPSMLPAYLRSGWADHYEKQWSSQKAVIAFTEQRIRGKRRHAPGGFTRYHVCYTHSHGNWSNLTGGPHAEWRGSEKHRGKQCQKQLEYRRIVEGMEGWGVKSRGGSR